MTDFAVVFFTFKISSRPKCILQNGSYEYTFRRLHLLSRFCKNLLCHENFKHPNVVGQINAYIFGQSILTGYLFLFVVASFSQGLSMVS